MRIRPIVLGLAAVAASAVSLTGAWEEVAPQSSGGRFITNAPAKADLTVDITAPAGVYVGDPGQYQVRVSNIGRRDASTVRLVIALPQTNTSPQVHVLGTLGAYDNRCSRIGTTLNCTLGTLAKNATTNVLFTIALPQSSAPIVIGASVTTTSAEVTTANNNDSDTAHLLHLFFPVSVGETAHVEHCTGTNLTSFFECMLYPSSISSHDISFDAGGMVSFIGQGPQYWGTWNQNAGDDYLALEYYDGASLAATFNGRSVGPTRCFEGVTTFDPPSQWVAPYRVCLP